MQEIKLIQLTPKRRMHKNTSISFLFLVILSLNFPFKGISSSLLERDNIEEKARFALDAYGDIDPYISRTHFSRHKTDEILTDNSFAIFFKMVKPLLLTHNTIIETLVMLQKADGDNPIDYPRSWVLFDLTDCNKGVTICHEKLRWNQLEKLSIRLEERIPILQETLREAVPYHMETRRSIVIELFNESIKKLLKIVNEFKELTPENPYQDADFDIPNAEDEIFEIEDQISALKKRLSALNPLLEKAQLWQRKHDIAKKKIASTVKKIEKAREFFDQYIITDTVRYSENPTNLDDIDTVEDATDEHELKILADILKNNENISREIKAKLAEAKKWQREHKALHTSIAKTIREIETAKSAFYKYMIGDNGAKVGNDTYLDDISDPIEAENTHDLDELEGIKKENIFILEEIKERLVDAKAWKS